MSDASKAVFLSYASQDAAAVERIAEALRAAGVEVWFDRNELVGGDAWDAKIRKQIAECALFVPVISAATQARHEGYFRLEWKLAAQRTHMMSGVKAFLLPVVIDETRDAEAHVPGEFKEVQWTRLPPSAALRRTSRPLGFGGPGPEDDAIAAFCARVQTLLVGGAEPRSTLPAAQRELKPGAPRPATPPRRRWVTVAAAALAGLVAVGAWLWLRRPASEAAAATWREASSATAIVPATGAMTEAQKLTRQARAVLDQDWMAGQDGFRLADELAQKAVALDVADGEAWATLGRISGVMIERNYDASAARRAALRSQAERAIRLAPSSVEAGLAMAVHQLVSGMAAEAVGNLRELLRRSPEDPRIVLALAGALDASGNAAEASKLRLTHPAFGGSDPRPLVIEAREIARRSPEKVEALVEAEALVDRAQALAPTLHGYMQKLVFAMQRRGDLDAARVLVERLPPSLLQEDGVATYAARLWLWRRDGEKALAVLRRAPRDFFEEGTGFGFVPKAYLGGWAMHLAGRPAGAQAEWKRALAVVEKRSAAEPDRADFLRWRALLLAMTGQRDEAEKIWRLSVDLATEARAAAHIQAEYLLASGKRDEAITRLESSKKHLSDFFVTIGLRYNPWFAEIRDDPRIQALIAEAEARLAAQRAVGQPASEKSVAVLAFKNLSGDPAREFVSDGLSEAVALVLGGVPGLKVVGSASAFSFKGKNTPIPEIARQLGVSHVVEGTVLQDGQNVRVTAKLIQADGFQVGAPQKVDRELKNILALHDEVAGLLAKNLSLSLNARSAASTAVLDPEAYQLYLEGMQAWSRRSGIAGEDDEVRRAQDLLGRALKLAPDFARAQATLADTWLMLYDGRYRNFSPDAAEFGRRARQEVERALALDPELVETQAAHARLLLAEQRYEESAVAFERAIRLNPNYAYARQWYGRLLCNRGRLEEGLAEMKIATQLDPLSPIVTSNYALYLSLARRWPEVMTVADRVLALAPDYGQTLGAKGYALIGLARFEEARQLLRGEATRKRTLAGDLRNMTARLLAGERGDLVQEAEARLAKPAELRLYDAVRLALALGRTDEAFRFARERPGDWRIDIALHFFFPGYDSVRSDHRFRQWLEDAGCRREYEQAWAEHLAWRRRTGSEH